MVIIHKKTADGSDYTGAYYFDWQLSGSNIECNQCNTFNSNPCDQRWEISYTGADVQYGGSGYLQVTDLIYQLYDLNGYYIDLIMCDPWNGCLSLDDCVENIYICLFKCSGCV